MHSRPPMKLDELVSTVEVLEGESLEACIQNSPWAGAFMNAPRMKDEKLREMFKFLVICSSLTKSPAPTSQKEAFLLREVRSRVFEDSETWVPKISFRDPDNLVEETFKLFEDDTKLGKNAAGIKKNLLVLRQDKVVRTELEPVFRDFIKTGSLHPGSVLQQCILSLL